MTRRHHGIVLVAAVAAGLAYLAGLAWDLPGLRLYSKPVPVLALALVVFAARRSDRRPGTGLLGCGLLASAAGDAWLELPGGFLPGLASFLAGHVCYAAAFVRRSRRRAAVRALPFVVWCGGALGFLWPNLGTMRVPVAVYVGVIAVMMWRAAALVDAGDGRAAWPAALGAVLFGVSDSLIAFDRFAAPVAGVRYPIIALYWAGQAGIAAGMLARARPPAGDGPD